MSFFKGIAGGVGGVLLIAILVVAVALRAKDSPEFFTAATQDRLRGVCCACTLSFSARRSTLIACGVLAVLELALSVASDCIQCRASGGPGQKLGLAAAAFILQFVGGPIMYCFSSCGCTLCCACAPGGCCNRTMQATSAAGCSVVLWFFAAAFFGWVITFLSLELVESSLGYPLRYIDYYSLDAVYGGPCFITATLVPSGLTSFAGILSAASLVLHGHFVTLVPEALHSLYPQDPAPAQVQPPQAVNHQPEALPEPGGAEAVYLTVSKPIDAPSTILAPAGVPV